MIWLASFPRSGNTFVRNILFEAYGLPSSTYHREASYPLDARFETYPFVKTHELPDTLEAAGLDVDAPAIYLVRDGRDALCSIAHHRSNLVAPGSDYYQNLVDAIVADRGSFFGGWSRNVDAWISRCDLVIRFEDLIERPLHCTERLRNIVDLPTPDIARIPTFAGMKSGIPEYGAGRHQPISESQKRHNATLFFRRGKAGAWRQEMPEELQELFWSLHGDTMERLGYGRGGDLIEPDPDLEVILRRKLGLSCVSATARTYRVLMEADKLASNDNDGIKRYQVELLKAIFPAVEAPGSRWSVDLYYQGSILPLSQFRNILGAPFSRAHSRSNAHDSNNTNLAQDERNRQGQPKEMDLREPLAKNPHACIQPNVFLRFERYVTGSVPRPFVHFLQRHDISLFHDIYEFVRSILVWSYDALLRLAPSIRTMSVCRDCTVRQEVQQPPKYDLIHIPLKQNFAAFLNDTTKKVVTFHDLTHLLFPQHHVIRNVQNAAGGVDFAREQGADVIAVSEATKTDILRYTPIPAHKIHVIWEAANPTLFHRKFNKADLQRIRNKYGLPLARPYIICLSTLEPRKNLTNTIRAFLLLIEGHPDINLSLVIAGKRGWDSQDIYSLAESAPDRVLFTGFVDDEDLPYLYSDALFLSYLSFYEGFGLPPLEAMRCGTPVVYAENSSLVEIVGDGGLPADPGDLQSIKRQYISLFQDPVLHLHKSRAALRQANGFSWRRTAIETLALYRKLIDGGR